MRRRRERFVLQVTDSLEQIEVREPLGGPERLCDESGKLGIALVDPSSRSNTVGDVGEPEGTRRDRQARCSILQHERGLELNSLVSSEELDEVPAEAMGKGSATAPVEKKLV